MDLICIGDKVRFLNEVGGGTVVKILPKNQIIVKDENDFDYPVAMSDVVVVEKAKENHNNQFKNFANNVVDNIKDNLNKVEATIITKPKIELKKDSKSAFLFAFIRNYDDKHDDFDCYLINDSNYFIFYHIVLCGENGFEKIDSEPLEPNTKINIGQLTRNQINNSKEIIIQSILFDNPKCTYHEMVERRIKITPIKFFQEHTFVDNDFFDEKAYIFELLKEDLGLGNSIRTQKEFEEQMARKDIEEEDNSRRFQKRKPAETIEIDLHINKLIDSVVGLSNSEILDIQIKAFHKTMTDAILNKAGKVIIIHGIGNGTLKNTIRESIEKQYKLHYEDASFREYGFGATMVLLN